MEKLNSSMVRAPAFYALPFDLIHFPTDLEDHWAAAVHKAERNHFVQRLQTLAYSKQVRITILSGDVHLAAVGRFFTKAKFNVPQERDHRYMVNVVSAFLGVLELEWC